MPTGAVVQAAALAHRRSSHVGLLSSTANAFTSHRLHSCIKCWGEGGGLLLTNDMPHMRACSYPSPQHANKSPLRAVHSIARVDEGMRH